MKPGQTFLKTLLDAGSLLLAVLAWVYLAPVPFGGRAAYVIISGNSMEPRFHRGDLVILQRAAAYQVGDIAVYRHPKIGPVIHRIVDREEQRFVFKGDNNHWLDPYRPEAAELAGKFWLHLPSAGRLVEQLRSPWGITLLAAGISLVGLTVVTGKRTGKLSKTRPSTMTNSLYASKADLFSVLIAAGLASLVLAVVAFTRPVLRDTSEDIPYQQAGVFSYDTDAPPGIYESDRVQTGEPVFRQLITSVNLRFDYEFSAGEPASLSGTYRLAAQLGHENGWKRTLELQPETKFQGPAFTVSSSLDLAGLQALIDSLEQQTGLYNQSYTLLIQPEVTITGALAGQAVSDKFTPALAFSLDPLQLQVAAERGSGPDTAGPFHPSQAGLLVRPVTVPNTITLLGLQLKVLAARQLALAGLVLSLGGCAALGWAILQAGQGDEPTRIQLKYGPLLVAVKDNSPQAGTVEVAAIADLAKIAEREGRMILVQAAGPTCHYLVQSGSVSYHYQCCRRAAAAKEETPCLRETFTD